VFQPATRDVKSVPRVRSRDISALLQQVERHATTLASFSMEPSPRWMAGGGSGMTFAAQVMTWSGQNAVLNIFSAIQ